MNNFLALEPIWDKLLSKSDSDNLFLSFDWLSTWWKHFGKGKSLYILLASIDGQPVAIAPLMKTREAIFRTLQFIGTGRSDYLDFIVTEPVSVGAVSAGEASLQKEQIINAIFSYIMQHRREWDVLNLRDIPEANGNLDVIERCCKANNLTYVAQQSYTAPHLPITESWDDFLKSMSKNFRRNIKVHEKKLWKCEGDIIITQHKNWSNPDELLDMITDIENCSWKVESGNPRFAGEETQSFFRELFDKFFKQGWLECWFVRHNQRNVAYYINFCYKNKLYVYNTNYDKEYSKVSPGTVLTNRMLQNAFERELTDFDFLRGGESYKYRYTDIERELYHIAIYKRTPYSKLAFFTLVDSKWRLKQHNFAHKLNEAKMKWKNRLNNGAISKNSR